MNRNRFFFSLTFVIAITLRYMFLSWKPPHFDESINGWFVDQVWEKGFYNYDPNNFHGPLYFYFLQFFEVLFGRSVIVLRAATGLLSLASIYLLFAHRKFVGRVADWAALFFAISPACVFYSRYAIHESLFIFAQILFSYGFWSWREKRTWLSCSQMIVAVFILATTKETYFIFLGTWLIAIISLRIAQKLFGQPVEKISKDPLTQGEKYRVAQVLVLCGVILFGLFSNLFSEPLEFRKFFEALAIWAKTGSGKSGHEKPLLYWIELLWHYEFPILLSLALSPLIFVKRNLPQIRVLAIFGFGTWLAYSIIPYKTPWLIIGMIWPLAFVLGSVIEDVRKRYQNNFVLAGCALFLLFPLIETTELNFVNYANESEKYVYVQSTKDIKVVTDLIEAQVKREPADFNLHIEVMTDEGWPFPYIFGHYPNLHFMKFSSIEEDRLKKADVIFYDGKDSVGVEQRLHSKYYRIPLQLRSAYLPGFALFRVSMFKGLLPEETLQKGNP